MNLLEVEQLNEEVAVHIGDNGYKWVRLCPKGHSVGVFLGKPEAAQYAECRQCTLKFGDNDTSIYYQSDEWVHEKSAAQFWASDYMLAWPIFWTVAFDANWGFDIRKPPGSKSPWLLHLWRHKNNDEYFVDIAGETYPEVLCRGFLEMVKWQKQSVEG